MFEAKIESERKSAILDERMQPDTVLHDFFVGLSVIQIFVSKEQDSSTELDEKNSSLILRGFSFENVVHFRLQDSIRETVLLLA